MLLTLNDNKNNSKKGNLTNTQKSLLYNIQWIYLMY